MILLGGQHDRNRGSVSPEYPISEVTSIARAKKIVVDPEIEIKTLNKLKVLQYETSSSMHRDFKNGKQHTELESLTGYVVRAEQELGIETPAFARAYNQLNSKNQNY